MSGSSAKPKTDTYLKGTNAIECRRCGAILEFKLPMAVQVWVAMAKAFDDAHCHCLSIIQPRG